MLWLDPMLLALWQTVYMVFTAGLCAVILGLPLGIYLFLLRSDQLLAKIYVYRPLTALVNGLRSVPFIILMVAIIPFTRFIVGTSIGTSAAIVPLTLASAPFFARVVENALLEVPRGVIEASIAMGASPWQIVYKTLLPESVATMIHGLTLMMITLVGYSAMAGAVGGGGLGDLAIRYGYERFNVQVMLVTVVILIVLVQAIQSADSFVRES